MQIENLPSTILTVIGILLLLKAIVGAPNPGAMQRLGQRGARMARQVNTLLAVASLLIAIALLIVVMLHQPLTNWLLASLALLFAWSGSVYYRPDTYERIVQTVLVNRKPMTVRIIFVCLGIIAIAMLVVAIGQY